jgi:predicted P-loop ATPase
VGAQKIGKSKFVKWLNPLTQYYADTSINPDDKDSVMRLATKWVCELPELGAITRRADREALKAFLSKEEITIRRPYGRNDETRPVLASFVGTFNNEGGILNDSTGSRRFVISEIQKITWDDYLKIDINQLWAQLFVAYKGGEETELSQTEYEESERNNRENFEVINPLEDLLTDRYFIDPDQPRLFETASSIFDYVISKDFKYFSPTQLSMDISRTLLKLGAQKTSRRIGGKVTRIFTGVEKII